MKILVGYTGFVGSNIMKQMEFDQVFNSQNINQAFGLNPDMLIYSGIRAEKFFADHNPEKDLWHIEEAISNIDKINPKQLVLISTVDVYDHPIDVNEDFTMNEEALTPYGKNRRYLEKQMLDKYPNVLIIRLPALFGENLKKNFLYDYIHFIPALLNEQKYMELSQLDDRIKDYYQFEKDGFYRCQAHTENQRQDVIECLKKVDFSALSFTDNRSVFQFYNLAYLAEHIQIALDRRLSIVNMATEPVSAKEVYAYLTNENFENETGRVFNYDFKTKHATIFGGTDGYLFMKSKVLADIKQFVKEAKHV